MENLFNIEALTALVTLTAMEIILGIDNIIFVSILTSKVPQEKQNKVRSLGITLALVIRILLLFSLKWLMGLTEILFTLFEKGFSARDLILLIGGMFLIAKSTFEIHSKLEGEEASHGPQIKGRASVQSIILQILALDIVFSLDSVITAVGMVSNISIMIIAMVLSMLVMLVSAKSIGNFVDKHPTIKVLALAFLILIGVVLVAEGMGAHVGKGYIYFAMFFSLVVEMINLTVRSKHANH